MTTQPPANRTAVREAIFAKKQFKRVKVTLWGTEVEFQQPSLDRILGGMDTTDHSLILRLIIDQCYVIGTNERVFESADLDTLKAMPFDTELNRISEVVGTLTGNVEGAEKN